MGCPCEKTTGSAPARLLLEERIEHLEDVQHNIGMIVLVLGAVIWLLWERGKDGEG